MRMRPCMKPTSGLTCRDDATNRTLRWPTVNVGMPITSIVVSPIVPPRNSSCVTMPTAPFHTSSTLNVTCVRMARPCGVLTQIARVPIASPTKIVPAPETSASNEGGITVVDRATPAMASVQISDSRRSRRIMKILLGNEASRIVQISWRRMTRTRKPAPDRAGSEQLLSDSERNRCACSAPVDVERTARLRVFDRDRELLGRLCGLRQRHWRSAEILALRIGHTPLSRRLADDQMPRAAGGDRVERVGAGRQREVAELQRAARDERGRLIGAGAPLAPVVWIDVLARDAALQRRPAVFNRQVGAIDRPLRFHMRAAGLAGMHLRGLLRVYCGTERHGRRCERDDENRSFHRVLLLCKDELALHHQAFIVP